MPLVSVIITVYNCEKYIANSLDSICQQTFDDYEIIVVNDGSTDSTWRQVENHPGLAKKKIKLIDNANNLRIPTRRNEAIRLAEGKYIAIHDGDDLSMPNRLSRQVAFLEANSSVFCCGGHAIRIDSEGIDTGPMVYPPAEHRNIVDLFLRQKRNPIIDPTTMFRRADFLDLGGYTLEKAIFTVPDMDLWGRAIISGRILRNLKEFLIRYRVNPNGMTVSHKPEMIKAHMEVWRRFAEQFVAAKAGSAFGS